jgi:hypothetical protein
MQDWPLRVTRLVDHAEREHGDGEIVTAWADGRTTRTDWRSVARDARKMARVGEGASSGPTLFGRAGAWNSAEGRLLTRIYSEAKIFFTSNAAASAPDGQRQHPRAVSTIACRWPTHSRRLVNAELARSIGADLNSHCLPVKAAPPLVAPFVAGAFDGLSPRGNVKNFRCRVASRVVSFAPSSAGTRLPTLENT